MIKSRPFYNVVCDACGADAQEDSDYAAWQHADSARDEAFSSDWWSDGKDVDLCEDCRPAVCEAHEERHVCLVKA